MKRRSVARKRMLAMTEGTLQGMVSTGWMGFENPYL
jgi:hypothetical protein